MNRPARAGVSQALVVTLAAVVAAALAAVVAAAPAAAAGAKAPATVTEVQPGTDQVVYVSRVAAFVRRVGEAKDGEAQSWRLNVGAWLHNDRSATLSLTRVEIAYTGGSRPPPKTVDLAATPVHIPPGRTRRVIVPEDRSLPLPVPDQVTLRFTFAGEAAPVEHSRRLAAYTNGTRIGSYYFPARAPDLAPGEYWANGTHANNQSELAAYDLKIRRWDEASREWRSTKPGTKGWANEDHYAFGKPVYAMADGLVLYCVRSTGDNVPTFGHNPKGFKRPGGGNHLFIRHASGEVAAYAHLQQRSVPPSLCPKERTDLSGLGITVKAGEKIGLVGNSGTSSNPHLHVDLRNAPPREVAGGLPDTAVHGRPLNFHNIDVRAAGSDWRGVDAPGVAGSWADDQPGATAGSFVLIRPNPCGWDAPRPEDGAYGRYLRSGACHRDVLNEAAFAGLRTLWVQEVAIGRYTYFSSVHGR